MSRQICLNVGTYPSVASLTSTHSKPWEVQLILRVAGEEGAIITSIVALSERRGDATFGCDPDDDEMRDTTINKDLVHFSVVECACADREGKRKER